MWLKTIQAQESDKHLRHFGKIKETRLQRIFEILSFCYSEPFVTLVLCSWKRGKINLPDKGIASERTTVWCPNSSVIFACLVQTLCFLGNSYLSLHPFLIVSAKLVCEIMVSCVFVALRLRQSSPGATASAIPEPKEARGETQSGNHSNRLPLQTSPRVKISWVSTPNWAELG